ncbi:DUF7322 domain-containing protein [Natronorubrum bangense]|uniref:DUF7322 domain-containing protein n=2 Tax=Natronorubrum bangense TaxID=61858 RepID=L9WPT8_9EURY|nr:hypothetical protein [Natronorubrum bangense]ELY51226.1 hypothetical protein C494_02710 [Natronorubrum bangense JCM 10635]QCC54782.1 hypothetical protein DV706_10070 [Natronorubrum bangense]
MGFDPPPDDDQFDDPFGDDPLEDPFAGDPLEDPFADDPFGGGDGNSGDDLEEAFSEGSRSTLLAFIIVAVLVHAGLFSASLGVMLIGFRGQWVVGSALAIGGVLALGLAVVGYRRYKHSQ